jgi:hypothetical protein
VLGICCLLLLLLWGEQVVSKSKGVTPASATAAAAGVPTAALLVFAALLGTTSTCNPHHLIKPGSTPFITRKHILITISTHLHVCCSPLQ